MRQRDSEGGFTIVDLVILVVLLGVVAAIVVSSIQVFHEFRAASACRADKQRVEVAVHAYHHLTGNQARSIEQLVSEGFLKDPAPAGNGYSVTVSGGVVTASGACT
jgi:competence protein ComGC